MNEIEQNVWRTVRAVTILAVLVVLLLTAISLSHAFDLPLAGAGAGFGVPLGTGRARQPYEPIGAGVRVQSYAEIIPGVQNLSAPDRGGALANTAHAWAVGPDQQGNMSSNTIADEQQLSASAQSVWPRPTAAVIIEGRSGLSAKDIAPTTTPSPIPPNAQDGQPVALARFWVQIPLANLRAGPGTEYAIVGTAAAGAYYPITARYGDWWQLDAGGVRAWVHGALGRLEGDSSQVPTAVVLPASTPPQHPLGAVVATAIGQPTATPTRLLHDADSEAHPGAWGREQMRSYSVELTRHPEANTVVIYALIQDNQAIVGDLYLLVEHNGQHWRSEPSSYAVQGVTKPSEPSSPYNRTYNAKIDFPLFLFPLLEATGDWAITLVDGAGQPLSVISTITIAPGDEQREIYLHYRKVKL